MTTEFLLELTVNADDGNIDVDHHPGISPATGELLASLIYAGLQGGEVLDIPPHRIETALAELGEVSKRDDRPADGMFRLQCIAMLEAREPGSAASCAEFATAYAYQFSSESSAPRKRGRPTMASGRFGKMAPGGVRVSGTKLDRAARRVRE
jgi:hypothetical protein